jgi:hypothetical protein
LLLAAHAGILDLVEEVFRPLVIPPEIIQALINMRILLAHPQPELLKARREIVALLASGACETFDSESAPSDVSEVGREERGAEWAALLREAQRTSGFVVDYLPLMRLDGSAPFTPPDWVARYLVNCRAVVDELRAAGALSADQTSEALSSLGSEARPVDGAPRLGRRAALYLHGNIPETLARAAVLEPACAQFRVRIGRTEAELCKNHVAVYERRVEGDEWLKQLIQRIESGIEAGIYKAESKPADTDDTPDNPAFRDPAIAGLVTLLRNGLSEDGALWVDDRYTNRYPSFGAGQVVDILDVLHELHLRGAIDESRLFSVLHAFRAENVRYIPLDKREILLSLRELSTHGGSWSEPKELAVLRKYLASCLLQSTELQGPQITETGLQSLGEMLILLESLRHTTTALVDVWADATLDEPTRQNHAEWILTRLYVERQAVPGLIQFRSVEKDDRYLTAQDLAGFIVQAVSLISPDQPDFLKQYYEWLEVRVLGPRLDADPELLTPTVTILQELMRGFLDDVSTMPTEQRFTVWLLQRLFDHLPEPIQSELRKDAELTARLGIQTVEMAVLGPWRFTWDAYWRAAADAVNGLETEMVPLETDAAVTFVPYELDGHKVFAVKDPGSGGTRIVNDEGISLLLESVEAREAALRRIRYWFDLSSHEFERELARIATIVDPSSRMEEAASWQEASAEVFYRHLTAETRERRRVNRNGVRPKDGAGLLRYYRLQGEESKESPPDFPDRWAVAAAQLLAEEGVEEALRRCVGLPVPLPTTLVDAVRAMPRQARRRALSHVLREVGSPLTRIHLAHLLGSLEARSPYRRGRIKRSLRRLLGRDSGFETDALLAVAGWVSDDFARWPAAKTWPADLRLAMVWAHAHRLFVALKSAGASPGLIWRLFAERPPELSAESLEQDSRYRRDVAHPDRISREVFQLGGLAYAVSAVGKQVVSDPLRESLLRLVFPTRAGHRVLVPDLYVDSTRANNLLGCFLGGRRDEQLGLVVGEDIGQIISPENARAAAGEMLDRLLDSSSSETWPEAWFGLSLLLGDLPPDPSLLAQVAQLVRTFDLQAYALARLEDAAFAAKVLSVLSGHVGDKSAQDRLEENLVYLASLCADRVSQGQLDSDTAANSLLNGALNLSIARGKALQGTVANFPTIVARLAEAWPAESIAFALSLQWLAERLPATVTRPLWRTILELRTR